ncbi:GNAT family N-acetyltransferase [Bacillus dakarensis]|uniref:GNAT family N-acetyltransferase n=1 Tax=Robertmurraya dakarensis TaxID=1926278 RepID=UPI0009809D68|nr:GNAT family protein [Bacillus dakarensis]
MFAINVDKEIQLQLFHLYDAKELFELVERNRYYLREWLPWVDSITSPYQYHSIIPMWHQQFLEKSNIHTGIRYKGVLVGSIGLHNIDWFNLQASIGYFLAENAQGKGIISRAVRALIHFAFNQLGLHRIEIRCGEKNEKSRAIPERFGFIREGIIRDGEKLNGDFHNLIVYGMLKNEWKD